MCEFIPVAKKAEIGTGAAKRVEVQGRKIALCNLDGEIHAVDDTCTHEEASLSAGEIVGDEIECPLHGACFNIRTGEAACLPAIENLQTYPVQIDGDDVLVRL